MPNSTRALKTLRLLKDAMNLLFDFQIDHSARRAGRECTCHCCRKTSTLREEVVRHLDRRSVADPMKLAHAPEIDREEGGED